MARKNMTAVCPVLENRCICPDHYLIRIYAPGICRAARPGQFLQVQVNAGTDPLLRRPFSIHDADPADGSVSIVYRVVGKGTRLLTMLRPDNCLDVIGPLGTGFTVPRSGGSALLVAGGMGMAPLGLLGRFLRSRGIGIRLFFGQKRRDRKFEKQVLKGFRRTGPDRIYLATDIRDTGAYHGTVTDLLCGKVRPDERGRVFSCGPWPMLGALARCTADRPLDVQVSLEENMACGIGSCLGCAVPRKSGGYYKACTEGPVFPAREIDFDFR